MARTHFQPSVITASSAIAAAIAALALTACGPNDNAETGPMAGGAAPSTTTVLPAPVAPPVERVGNPVPDATVATQPQAYVAPAPVQMAAAPQSYAPAPYAQPGNPATNGYPAQAGQPVRATNGGYANTATRVAERPIVEPRPVDRSHAGSIESIVPVRERPQGSGAGAVIGGVLGAVVGNQFGHGSGRAVMTGAGAVGGALAGNHIERARNESITGYRVSVRLDNGSIRTFERGQIGGLQVGDRVRVDAGSFRRV